MRIVIIKVDMTLVLELVVTMQPQILVSGYEYSQFLQHQATQDASKPIAHLAKTTTTSIFLIQFHFSPLDHRLRRE